MRFNYHNHKSRWDNAIRHCRTQHFEIHPIETQYPDYHRYVAASASKTGELYLVTLYRGHTTDVFCTCPAGMHQQPCKHAAKVLLREGVFREVEVPIGV